MKYTKTGFPLPFLLRTFAYAQCLTWSACDQQYRAFRTIRQKKLSFEGFALKAQYNPARMKSTSAQVDHISIAERPCFLCRDNLPPEQHAVLFPQGFFLLVNPFPIISPHYTIILPGHTPQQLLPHFDFMTQVAYDAEGEFALFYNGPRVGASAPDHLHFQAAPIEALPMLKDFANYKERFSFVIFRQATCVLYGFDDGVRRGFFISSHSMESIRPMVIGMLRAIGTKQADSGEPDVNTAAFREHDSDVINVIIFPRTGHRPSCFYNQGDEQFLWSPAALDLCGIQVLPRECDFQKAESSFMKELYSEVIIEPSRLRAISTLLLNAETR